MRIRFKIFCKTKKISDWRAKVNEAIESGRKMSLEELQEIIKDAPQEELKQMRKALIKRLEEIAKEKEQ